MTAAVDWSTPEGLRSVRESLAATIPGWVDPALYAVGIGPGAGSREVGFPHVNADGTHLLPALVLASVVGHRGGTATYDMGVDQLAAAVEQLAPAEACTALEHPNLWAWRDLLAQAAEVPALTLTAVFVGDLADPPASEADAELRALVEAGAPAR
jgi:hypothetical protein